MATGKKSVLLYCDLIHTIEKMDNETAGVFFKHYLRYINDLEPKTDNLLVEITFESVKQNLKRDLKKWEEERKERSVSGQLGNLKRYNLDLYKKVKNQETTLEEAIAIAISRKESHSDTKVAVTDTVNVTVTVNDKVKDILVREAEFKNSLQPLLETYGKDLLNEFYLYWTEKKPKGRKMRFELEKTFDIERRLQRWSKNDFNNKNNNNLKAENNEQLKSITTDIRANDPNL